MVHCEERAQLLMYFRTTAQLYSDIVRELARVAGLLPQAEFAFLNKKAVQAQQVCKAARDRYEQHLQEHRCRAAQGIGRGS